MMNTRSSTITKTDAGLAAYMRQIFNYMTGAVALSGLMAYLTVNSHAMLSLALGPMKWVFMIVWFAFGFFMHKIIFKLSPMAALGVLAGFSALTGFALAPMVLMYTGADITIAFFTASAMFGGAALYGYATNKSLSGWGNFLMMACWGLIAAIVVNLVGSMVFGASMSGLSLIISLIAVPLFAGLTAYETNMLRDAYYGMSRNSTQVSQMAIYGATSLYMNFVVMFIHLLQLVGLARD